MARTKPALKAHNPVPNGLACPVCGSQLLDSRPNMVLDSHPPQKDVHCDDCDYEGYEWLEPERYGRTYRNRLFGAA